MSDRVPEEFSSGIGEYCRRFQALADATTQMMWRFGPDGECKYVNRRWLEYRGRTEEQERGAGWMEGVHPEDLSRCATAYRSAFESRQPFHLEFRVKCADASYGSVVAHAVPQYLLDGSFVGYVGSLEEASHQDSGSAERERRAVGSSESARQALCQIAASLRQASSPASERRRTKRRKQKRTLPGNVLLECLDISITPLLVVDQSGRAIYCNCAFQELAAKRLPTTRIETASSLTKWPRLTGKSNSRREYPPPSRNCAPEVQAWLDADSITNEQDIRVSAKPLAVAGNELTMFSIIDTTQENRTRLLERAFLHDLVNAAGSIQMLIDLLTGGTSRQERDEYINLLQVSVNRLLSEIYHEKMMLDSFCTPFNVREILTALAEYYRHHFGRNCRIEITESAAESLALAGDQTLLVRVLDNMLRNAVEAAGHGGLVTLGCRQIGGEFEFWVHNPNTISENVRAKIFHPSFTVDGKDRDQDTKLLGELCGGTVAVSSDQQSGTTYSVRYPAAVETVFPQKRYHTKHAS